MNPSDEKLRATVHDALTRANIDSRNLAVEVVDSRLTVKGSVPSEDQQEQLGSVLRQCVPEGTFDCPVSVRKMVPTDRLDGRGRSPVTGTSPDSAHESRHQLDRT